MQHTFVFHTINLAKRLQKIIGFKSPDLLLSYSEATTLLIINFQNEISQKDIAQKLNLAPASVVSLMDKLEKSGLVKRVISNNDRRKHQIILTNQGQSTLKKIQNKTYQLDEFLKNNLTSQEFVSFYKILGKLTKLISLQKEVKKDEISNANRWVEV